MVANGGLRGQVREGHLSGRYLQSTSSCLCMQGTLYRHPELRYLHLMNILPPFLLSPVEQTLDSDTERLSGLLSVIFQKELGYLLNELLLETNKRVFFKVDFNLFLFLPAKRLSSFSTASKSLATSSILSSSLFSLLTSLSHSFRAAFLRVKNEISR